MSKEHLEIVERLQRENRELREEVNRLRKELEEKESRNNELEGENDGHICSIRAFA